MIFRVKDLNENKLVLFQKIVDEVLTPLRAELTNTRCEVDEHILQRGRITVVDYDSR